MYLPDFCDTLISFSRLSSRGKFLSHSRSQLKFLGVFLENSHSQLSNITCFSFLSLRSQFLTLLRNRHQWEIHQIKSTGYINMAVMFALKARTEKRQRQNFCLTSLLTQIKSLILNLDSQAFLANSHFHFQLSKNHLRASFSFSKFTL